MTLFYTVNKPSNPVRILPGPYDTYVDCGDRSRYNMNIVFTATLDYNFLSNTKEILLQNYMIKLSTVRWILFGNMMQFSIFIIVRQYRIGYRDIVDLTHLIYKLVKYHLSFLA